MKRAMLYLLGVVAGLLLLSGCGSDSKSVANTSSKEQLSSLRVEAPEGLPPVPQIPIEE